MPTAVPTSPLSPGLLVWIWIYSAARRVWAGGVGQGTVMEGTLSIYSAATIPREQFVIFKDTFVLSTSNFPDSFAKTAWLATAVNVLETWQYPGGLGSMIMNWSTHCGLRSIRGRRAQISPHGHPVGNAVGVLVTSITNARSTGQELARVRTQPPDPPGLRPGS